jgi:DNA-binding response OmpR family regulator
MSEMQRVTVVNDSPEFLELMADVLHDASYPATVIDGDRDNALALIEAAEPEILIIDLRLGSEGLHGLDIVRWARQHPQLSQVPTIVCSADRYGVEQVRDELDAMSGVTVLMKPFSVDELYAALRALTPA